MSNMTRHLAGLVLMILLVALLYKGWETMNLLEVLRLLRSVQLIRTFYVEFMVLIGVCSAYLVLSFSQWLWDKLPGGEES